MDATEPTAEQQLPAATSGKAVASLILGIVAMGNIKRDPARIKGSGLAIAGIIVSCVSFGFVFLELTITPPPQHKAKAKRIVSMSNLRQLSLAAIMYTEDNDGNFPPSENWPEVLRPYYRDDKLLISPFAPEAGRGYAMNANLDNHKRSEIQQTAQIVLFFECKPDSPPGGGQELLPEPPKAGRGYTFSFLDGHAELVRKERVDELIWEPHLRP